jgi:hypothetical protein
VADDSIDAPDVPEPLKSSEPLMPGQTEIQVKSLKNAPKFDVDEEELNLRP